MDIHPHWDTTEPAPPKPTARPSVAPRVPHRVPIVARGTGRQVAAALGIMLTIGIGLWQTDAWQTLGQVLPSWTSQSSSALPAVQAPAQSVTITLTNKGAMPDHVSIAAGGTMVFVNQSDIPYVLEAKGMLGAEGGAATVPFVFPSSSQTFSIAQDQPVGTYIFTSATDAAFSITVTVLPASNLATSSTDASVHTAASSASSMADTAALPTLPATPPDDSHPSAPLPPAPAEPTAALPRNPYTVGSHFQHPFDDQGNPIPDRFNADGTLKTDDGSLHAGAPITRHHPRSNPSTGPAVGLTLAASTVILWWRTRSRKTLAMATAT